MAELPSNNKIPQKFADQEIYSSISNIDAAFSGVASGLIKIPEGLVVWKERIYGKTKLLFLN